MANNDKEDKKKKGKKWFEQNMARDLQVSRAIEGQVNRYKTDLDKLHKEVIEKINAVYDELTAKKIDKLADELTTHTTEKINSIVSGVKTGLFLVAERQIDWNLKKLMELTGQEPKYLNSEKVAEKAMKKTYQGHTFNFWFKSLGMTEPKRVVQAIKSGYVEGKTIAEVRKEIQAIQTRTDNDFKTLVRSGYHHVQAEAKYDSYNEFEEAIDCYFWVATLDHRTTPHICGIRDLKKYDKNFKPIGHNLPWGDGPGRIHFNCRSTFFAAFEGMEEMINDISRPAFGSGDEYESGANKTSTGRVRKPTRKNVDKGVFSFEKVKGGTTYEEHLKKQDISYISDVFRGDLEFAKEFKAGKASLMDWVKQGKENEINEL